MTNLISNKTKELFGLAVAMPSTKNNILLRRLTDLRLWTAELTEEGFNSTSKASLKLLKDAAKQFDDVVQLLTPAKKAPGGGRKRGQKNKQKMVCKRLRLRLNTKPPAAEPSAKPPAVPATEPAAESRIQAAPEKVPLEPYQRHDGV